MPKDPRLEQYRRDRVRWTQRRNRVVREQLIKDLGDVILEFNPLDTFGPARIGRISAEVVQRVVPSDNVIPFPSA
jgi:hypothetical protein